MSKTNQAKCIKRARNKGLEVKLSEDHVGPEPAEVRQEK